jgi:endonuclease/exonuclease/phosphatase family metal-dependent hydrolase
MRDIYRDVHQAGAPFPHSYFTGQKEPLTGHRYDYIFASRDLEARSCEYLTAWIEKDRDGGRLSDHTGVEAVLDTGVEAVLALRRRGE